MLPSYFYIKLFSFFILCSSTLYAQEPIEFQESFLTNEEPEIGTSFPDDQFLPEFDKDILPYQGYHTQITIDDYNINLAKLQTNNLLKLQGYFMAGLAQENLDSLSASYRDPLDDREFAYGLGVYYSFLEDSALNIEYLNVEQRNDLPVHAINLGLTYRF